MYVQPNRHLKKLVKLESVAFSLLVFSHLLQCIALIKYTFVFLFLYLALTRHIL